MFSMTIIIIIIIIIMLIFIHPSQHVVFIIPYTLRELFKKSGR